MGNWKLSSAFLLHWMKIEVNNIYDLLLKFLLLKSITLPKLLVLSFPEGSVTTIDRTFVFVQSRQCSKLLSVSSTTEWAAPEVTETPELVLDTPGATEQLRPCPQLLHLMGEVALSLGIIFMDLLPLGVLSRCLAAAAQDEPSSARGEGTELEPAPGSAYLCADLQPYL